MYVRAPEPVGYDSGGVGNPEFGVLALSPWRVELVDGPGASRVWRAWVSSPQNGGRPAAVIPFMAR